MALTYYYPDAYLQPLVTEPREQRAVADVAELGTLPAQWLARLVVLRAYIITCLESQQAADDLFGTKLSAYRREWDAALSQARAAQASADSAEGSSSFFTVALERS